MRATPSAARVSYLGALTTSHRHDAVTFEDWVTRRFGRVLYEIYFKPYTEKVWGIRCDQLSADWAAQRISVPNLAETVRGAVFPPKVPAPTAVRQFYYPRHGYGTISDRLVDGIAAERQEVLTSTSLAKLHFSDSDAVVDVVDDAGAARTIRCGQVISTVPLDALLTALVHEPGIAEVAADTRLAYRGIILVFLGIARPQVSPDSWTYFPSPDLVFGRSHEPKNWSAAMVPTPRSPRWRSRCSPPRASRRGTAATRTWSSGPSGSFRAFGWLRRGEVTHSWVLRVPHAYPVHNLGYAERFARVRRALDRYPRLRLLGTDRRVRLHERRRSRRGLLPGGARAELTGNADVQAPRGRHGPLGLAGATHGTGRYRTRESSGSAATGRADAGLPGNSWPAPITNPIPAHA